jgi:hypothetical protein
MGRESLEMKDFILASIAAVLVVAMMVWTVYSVWGLYA